MKNRLLKLFSAFALFGLFATPALAEGEAPEVTASGTYFVDEEFVLKVDARDFLDQGLHELEIDFDSGSAFGPGRGGGSEYFHPGYSGFSVYVGTTETGIYSNGDPTEKAKFDAAGVGVQYSDGVWTITSAGPTLKAMFEHGEFQLTMALRDTDGAGLWGTTTCEGGECNNDEVGTFTYTVLPEFTLDGFEDSRVRMNTEGTFNGELHIPANAIEGVYTMTLSGGDDSLVATSVGVNGGDNILNAGELPAFSIGGDGGIPPGSEFTLDLDVTFVGTKVGTHDLTFTILDPNKNVVVEEDFKLTVWRPSSGGSSSSKNNDKDEEELEETEVEEEGTEEDTIFEFDNEEYDLNNMTPEDTVKLIDSLRARLIELIMAYIAELQALVASGQS